MPARLETFASADALAQAAADEVFRRLTAGLDGRGEASLVATGGRSPGPLYDWLCKAPLNWSRVTVTLSDERCVAADASEANARLVRERLLRGPAGAAAFLPLWRDGGAVQEGEIRALTPFDAVVLGVGDDGHVASLIPGMPGLAEAMDPDGARLVAEAAAGFGSPPVARITLTLAALLQARTILLLTAGEAKRRVIEAALAGAELPVRALLVQDRVPVRALWAPHYQD